MICCSSADGLRLMCRWSPLTSFIGTTSGDLHRQSNVLFPKHFPSTFLKSCLRTFKKCQPNVSKINETKHLTNALTIL
jgi:hypothetical protein